MIPLFHYALRPSGYLFLGPSENVTTHRDLFRTVDKKHRLYQRKESVLRPQVLFPLSAGFQSAMATDRKTAIANERNLPKQLERIILQRFRPACVTVKESGDAVYFSGPLSDYLEQPFGSPETNLLNMAREGLRIPLRTALRRAVSGRERVDQEVSVGGGRSVPRCSCRRAAQGAS
jgi:two-component system CheB/CheR fusion protein